MYSAHLEHLTGATPKAERAPKGLAHPEHVAVRNRPGAAVRIDKSIKIAAAINNPNKHIDINDFQERKEDCRDDSSKPDQRNLR